MNLLKEGIAQDAVIKTTMTRKLTIDGITRPYPVYKVDLDWLFYNDQNDRIATWISQYKAEHDGKAPDPVDREAYNAIIESFIVESNPDSIRKTQNNIELVDQREAGVTLADGRIIDGNCRFTCLRRLAKKNEKFRYFETVILDRKIEDSAKQIKLMELAIQIGEIGRTDYNPVDRLVGVYHDIVETKLLTVKEYSDSTNEEESIVKKRVETAKAMMEFLDFLNAPGRFHIARDLQVVFPLEEMGKLTKKCTTNPEALKKAVFANIALQTAGDMTRHIRGMKAVIGSEQEAAFVREQSEFAEQLQERLQASPVRDVEEMRQFIRENHDLAEELESSNERFHTKMKKMETRLRPLQNAEKATALLDDVDTRIFQKMEPNDLLRLDEQIKELQKLAESIREEIRIAAENR